MFWRRWLLAATGLAAFLFGWQAPVWGQQEPATPEQVIAKYLEAIGGADRFSSITTFVKVGELSGNLTNFALPYTAPILNKQHGTFEFYFKAPNLHLSVVKADNNVLLGAYGCDGTMAWSIASDGRRSEFKPKPGNEYGCETGYNPVPRVLRAPNVKMRLKGTAKVEGQPAYAVWVRDPKSPGEETYYFDVQTYLLVRLKTVSLFSLNRSYKIDLFYSDYRDVGGIKLPFKIIQQSENNKLVTTLREVKINAPVDDARFAEPGTPGNSNARAREESPPPAAKANQIDILPASPPETHAAASVPSLVEVNFPNFASCGIAELKQTVPELRGLKAAQGQEELTALLDKVGAKTADLAQATPDLISHEAVVKSQQDVVIARQNFSYLMLSRPRGQEAVILEEFRVDLQTGEKFQAEEAKNGAAPESHSSASSLDLPTANQQLSVWKSGGPPLSQGFASMWTYFYPLNRPESAFRYLGQQKMDGHHTVVLAFAQKPGSVRLPTEFRFEGRIIPIFLHGVAWVDAFDFQIVRLRTDLLSPFPEDTLRRLTADIQFAQTTVAGVALPLWLPRDVVVTSDVRGVILREDHKYSDYRAFRVQTKMVPHP